jgi:serine/threonine-protein phosphatase 2A regulatory subunit B'
MEMNKKMFDECKKQYKQERQKREKERKRERDEDWKRVEEMEMRNKGYEN